MPQPGFAERPPPSSVCHPPFALPQEGGPGTPTQLGQWMRPSLPARPAGCRALVGATVGTTTRRRWGKGRGRGGQRVNSRQLLGPILPVLEVLWWRSGLSLWHLPRREGPILQMRKLRPTQLGRGRARGKWDDSNSRARQSGIGEAAGPLLQLSAIMWVRGSEERPGGFLKELALASAPEGPGGEGNRVRRGLQSGP